MSVEAPPVPQEAHHRRAADAIDDTLRNQAINVVFDSVVDREQLKVLTRSSIARICREYEARLRALGGL